jgi:antitoxin component YwqK of YwqJK toxin-antitoxin module
VPAGTWKVFYEIGAVAEEKTYISGKREGLYRQYNDNGKLIFEMTYKSDKEHGPVKIYYADGTIRETGTFINGLKEGSWIEYDTRGGVVKNEVFRAGLPVKKSP